jgi:O-methyltransferase
MKAGESLYLELLKKTLTDYRNADSWEMHPLAIVNRNRKTALLYPIDKLLRKRNFGIHKLKYVSAFNRFNGYDWPAQADTMIGINRLNNIEACMLEVLRDNIPGDFIETGVWRGGATIFMRAVLKEYNITDRTVWLADSFAGLPQPDAERYPADKGNYLHGLKILTASLEDVKRNFGKYDLLDDQVRFLPGWFEDTLPAAPIERLAVLRLDGDMYSSTIQALDALYPKLSPGGFVIIDDYNAFPNCKKAVEDYRAEHGITDAIVEIDREAVFWRKG